MKTSDFDYVLPPERIAQEPLARRDASRLLVLDRETGAVSHRAFRDLPALLAPGDLLVLNDTRVLPARLFGLREKTGGRIEVVLLEEHGEKCPAKESGAEHVTKWRAFTRSGGKLVPGEWLKLAGGRARAMLVERLGEPGDVLEVRSREPLRDILADAGHMPVPPYVRRERDAEPSRLDRERYQTVYAHDGEPAAVAAPTAGLHFTEQVFADLDARGIARTFVTLDVGPGTFRSMKAHDVEAHAMDAEHYEVPPGAARAIAECRARGGRVVAVGTTTVRTLESAATGNGLVREGPGTATLFITPGHEFRAVDILLTNFHLPKGTPLVLTCTFAGAFRPGTIDPTNIRAGRENVLRAYDAALREDYRFLSYGDAMLVL